MYFINLEIICCNTFTLVNHSNESLQINIMYLHEKDNQASRCKVITFLSFLLNFLLIPRVSPGVTEVRAWGRRSSTSATSPAAGRFMGRRPISELTCAGTAGRGRSSATGCSVGRGSPGATSCRDTGGHTPVRPRPLLLIV